MERRLKASNIRKVKNMDKFSKNATVVLVHGAWADGSSWNQVILPLLHEGLKVICAPIPLTSLSDDAAALRRVLERIDGPVLLAGHAYAGAVIAAATDEKVRSLVYIAALAPDEGETVADQPKDATFHGKADGSEGSSSPSRSHSASHGARGGDRYNTRSRLRNARLLIHHPIRILERQEMLQTSQVLSRLPRVSGAMVLPFKDSKAGTEFLFKGQRPGAISIYLCLFTFACPKRSFVNLASIKEPRSRLENP
jgi:pimeloyl-ACP methyl ester carboxylesterase